MSESNIDPMISVVVTTYNQESTIARTLDSILAQKTRYTFEIILGEDASPSDNTRGVCEKYAERWPDIIHLMPRSANKGLLVNYADCLATSRGRYIATCAGDDWWHNENKIELQVSFLEQNPDYILSYSGATVENLDSGKKSEARVTQVDQKVDLFARLLKSNFIIAPTVCFRRSALEHIDFAQFIERGYLAEDYPMWLTMSRYGKFHALDLSTVTYTQAVGSISNFDSIDRQMTFSLNMLQMQRDIVLGLGLEDQYSAESLEDDFHRSIYNRARNLGEDRIALEHIRKVRNKKMSDRAKILAKIIVVLIDKINK